jgi:hypothetical protein
MKFNHKTFYKNYNLYNTQKACSPSSYSTLIKPIKLKTTLNYSDITPPFELRTNVSDIGISAILTQRNKLIGIDRHKLSGLKSTTQLLKKKQWQSSKDATILETSYTIQK